MNPNLDVLRAVAVSFVVFGHLCGFYGFLPTKPVSIAITGMLGVEIVFVHTALVLMQSMERQQRESAKLFIPFMIRRCFRIYPLAVLCIGLVIMFAWPMAVVTPGKFYGYRPDTQDIIANLSLLPDLSGRVPVLGPAWSLSTELQMYVLLPGLFLWIRAWRKAVLVWLGAAAVCFMVPRVLHNHDIFLLKFAPCFLAGVLAYAIGQRPRLKWWPGFLAALILAYLVVPSFPGSSWLFALVLGVSIPWFKPISNRWLTAVCKGMAKYSYSMYLTHFFALWVTFQKLAGLPFAIKLCAYLGLIGVLSYVLYHVVENPMIEFGKRMATAYTGRTEAARPGVRAAVPAS